MALQVDEPGYVASEGTQLSLAFYLFRKLIDARNVKGQEVNDGKMTMGAFEAWLTEFHYPKYDAVASYVNLAKGVAGATDYHSTRGVDIDNVFKVK